MNLPPISNDSPDDGNVLQLKVPFKRQETNDRVLSVVIAGKCYHTMGFLLDESLEHVHCKQCNEALNPMFVLKQLANKENHYHATAVRYQEEMARLANRSRTKCQHCGEMTRISHS